MKQCCNRKDPNNLEVTFEKREVNQKNNSTINQLIQNHNSPDKVKNPSHTSILTITLFQLLSPLNGVKLKITNAGLIDSLRQSTDGITYFGYQEDNAIDNHVDFILPPLSNSPKDKYIGRYFQIAYQPIIGNYYLKDLGNGLGTFVKITHSVLLTNNTLISIGDSYIAINFLFYETNEGNEAVKSKARNNLIQLQVFDCLNNKEAKIYTFDSNKDLNIRIGRQHYNNNIELEDPLVSKLNSIIEYAQNDGWYLSDGNRLLDRSDSMTKKSTTASNTHSSNPSTNGTWILAIDDIEIVDEMVFKANSIIFICHISNHHKQTIEILKS